MGHIAVVNDVFVVSIRRPEICVRENHRISGTTRCLVDSPVPVWDTDVRVDASECELKFVRQQAVPDHEGSVEVALVHRRVGGRGGMIRDKVVVINQIIPAVLSTGLLEGPNSIEVRFQFVCGKITNLFSAK
jgi:hypothetical protein